MSEMLEVMRRRRSVRKFTAEGVSDAQVESLVNAGLLAPSAKNIRPVELLVLRDKATIERLEGCRDAGAGAFKTATLAIIVAARADKSDLWSIDAAIAATQIHLEAEALGLGCCWVQVLKRPCGDTSAEEAVRKVAKVPPELSILCMMALGHGDEAKEPYVIEKLDRSAVHYL